MMDGELTCVVNNCTENAVGMILVNDNKSGVTMFMLPMCNEHGQHAKTKEMSIVLRGDDEPSISMVSPSERPLQPDVSLTYEVYDAQ